MAEYFARQGTTALGIIGTALGGLATVAGGGSLLGRNVDSDNHYVTRYENDLVQENGILKAQADVDKKLVDVYNAINDRVNGVTEKLNTFEKEQLVYNGVNTATLQCMQNNINTLMGLTKVVIPNANVCPGWGTATVSVSTGTATA